MKIKLTESQLQEMIGASIMEAFEDNPELQEGWLGNMFKAGAQTIGNKVGKAYNDFAGRVNTLNAKEQGDKANALQQELEGMPAQIKQQVKQYRQQLMSDVNTKVAEYARELKADMQKKQNKLTGIRGKQQRYQDKATANQQRYDQLHQQTSGRNMNEEEKLHDMISEAVRNVLKK
jgi:cell division septum initiation protein DivIVA